MLLSVAVWEGRAANTHQHCSQVCFQAPVLAACCQLGWWIVHETRSNHTNPLQFMEPSSRSTSGPPCPAPLHKLLPAKLLSWSALTAAHRLGWHRTKNNSYLLKQVNELERSTKERRETGLGVLWVHRGEMGRQLCRTSAYGLSWGITGPRHEPVLMHLPQPHVPRTWEGRRLPLLLGALCWVLAQVPQFLPGQGIPGEPMVVFLFLLFFLIALLFLPISCLSHTSFKL